MKFRTFYITIILLAGIKMSAAAQEKDPTFHYDLVLISKNYYFHITTDSSIKSGHRDYIRDTVLNEIYKSRQYNTDSLVIESPPFKEKIEKIDLLVWSKETRAVVKTVGYYIIVPCGKGVYEFKAGESPKKLLKCIDKLRKGDVILIRNVRAHLVPEKYYSIAGFEIRVK